jgi:hypothetical protein
MGKVAGAIRYATSRWPALTHFVDDGQLEMTNNAAERAIRPLALARKNYLFAGSDAGGRRAAILYTLIETCRLNYRGLARRRRRPRRRTSVQSPRRPSPLEMEPPVSSMHGRPRTRTRPCGHAYFANCPH